MGTINKKEIIMEVIDKITSRSRFYQSQILSGGLSERDLEALARYLLGSGALEGLSEKDWAQLKKFAEGTLDECPPAGSLFVFFCQTHYSVPVVELSQKKNKEELWEDLQDAVMLYDHALLPL